MAEHIKTGQIGEELVCGYIKKKGYKLIEKNYREKWGEIDIIAINTKKTLCFIEVKTLKISSESIGDNSEIMGISPEDNLTKSKLTKLIKVCEFYANNNQDLIKRGWQIDLAAVYLNRDNFKKCEIKYYENIA